MFALIETSKGKFKIKLFPEKAPKTVDNFVGLAEGTKEWTDPKTGNKVKKKFYDGLTFHRIVPGFVIQGGDPLGNGTGGPGYKFDDEIAKDLNFEKPGMVAMANAGKNTNGSQFFVTVSNAPPVKNLTGGYTIFGEIVDGMNVVNDISKVQTVREKPAEDVVIKSIKVERAN
ncbi:MAG: peptidyl-prolyl cis-trans isomerase [Bdellovibrio sp.]|nr:MAG: peptidyl-prolyl cis-trans isomerase [Bdellovibrio sp.]